MPTYDTASRRTQAGADRKAGRFQVQSPYTGQAEGWGLPLLLAGWRQDGSNCSICLLWLRTAPRCPNMAVTHWDLGEDPVLLGFPLGYSVPDFFFVLVWFGLNFLNSISITTNNAFY